ncbi:DUF2254 family protein [Streptomyces anulatus]|uniref:DUF2254 family protein n=1 Tax=Streptomyces anulatus TaxID=1892 RepID=UPI003870B359
MLGPIGGSALSPAVNDPTTAVQFLDQIEAVLLRLAHRPLGTTTVHDHQGVPRFTLPRPGWEEILDLALSEMLHYGSGSLQGPPAPARPAARAGVCLPLAPQLHRPLRGPHLVDLEVPRTP